MSQEAPAAMLDLLMGAVVSQAVAVAAKLGIADVLADGPRTAEEIAGRVDADLDGVDRLLRTLAGHGVFRADGTGRYELTPLAKTLRSDVAASLRSYATYLGAAEPREYWSHLIDAVRTGGPVIEQIRGMDTWTYFEQNRELAELFNDAMTGLSDYAREPVVEAYDFTRFRTIVDVAGGHGALLAAILARAPEASGVLFDQPSVTADAELGAVRDRCTVESGSFFEKIPPGGDAYVLKSIIHDWQDDEAVAILRNVRAAINPDGTLLLVEAVLPEGNEAHPARVGDLVMLLTVGGRERTEAQYRNLLSLAGFTLVRVVPTATMFSIIEATVDENG